MKEWPLIHQFKVQVLIKLESKLILQVHDEIIIDAKEEEVPKLKEILYDAMENIVKLSVPLKIDINTGTDWYDAK